MRFPLKASVAITGTTDAPQILAGEVMLQPDQSVFRLTLKTDGRGDCSGIEIRPSGGETVFRAGTLLYGDTEIPRPYGGCPFGKGYAVDDGRLR